MDWVQFTLCLALIAVVVGAVVFWDFNRIDRRRDK